MIFIVCVTLFLATDDLLHLRAKVTASSNKIENEEDLFDDFEEPEKDLIS